MSNDERKKQLDEAVKQLERSVILFSYKAKEFTEALKRINPTIK